MTSGIFGVCRQRKTSGSRAGRYKSPNGQVPVGSPRLTSRLTDSSCVVGRGVPELYATGPGSYCGPRRGKSLGDWQCSVVEQRNANDGSLIR